MRRGEANFKVVASGLAGAWIKIGQYAYNFIYDALADAESISAEAPKSLENGEILGLHGLGMEPANHNTGSARRSTAAAGQETFNI
mgnify:CR=1 FL=1